MVVLDFTIFRNVFHYLLYYYIERHQKFHYIFF